MITNKGVRERLGSERVSVSPLFGRIGLNAKIPLTCARACMCVRVRAVSVRLRVCRVVCVQACVVCVYVCVIDLGS